MPDYRLSKRASADLADIADYTIQTFGIAQARKYRDALRRCFLTLAEAPTLGRSATHIAPHLHRFEFKSHIIFYRLDNNRGILIVRILHASMDIKRHL